MTKTMMTLARATMLVVLLLTPTFFLPARAEEGEKQRLKYGVINFEFPPYLYYDDTNTPQRGFFFEVLRMFGESMNATIELVPIPDFFFDLDVTAFMSRHIAEGNIDFGWSNVADFDREGVTDNVTYAGAWQFPEFVVIGKKTIRSRTGYMQFLEPFSNGLWSSVIGSIVAGGFVLMVLLTNNDERSITERQEKKDLKLMAKTQLRSVYYVFCTILGAESPEFEYEMISGSLLGRIYRIGLLFLVLMVGATYTATLASVLIKSNAIIYHGPSTLEELKESTACILITTSTSTVLPYIGRNAPNPLTIKEQANATLNEKWTHAALMNGECDVIIRPKAYQYITPGMDCDRIYVIQGLTLAPSQWYQFTAGTTPEQRKFAKKAHGHIDRIVQTAEYQRLYTEHFTSNGQCPEDVIVTDEAIEVDDLAGVFIIYGVVCAFVILCSLFHTLITACKKNRQTKKRIHQDDSALSGMLYPGHGKEEESEGRRRGDEDEDEDDDHTTMDELIRLVSRLKRSRAARRCRDFVQR